MSVTLLVDADVDAYAVCSSAEHEVDWGDGVYTVATDLEEAKTAFTRRINMFKRLLGADDVLLCFTSKDNYRKDLVKEYKANRTGRKPLGYYELVEWAKKNFPSKTYPRLEADDVMGILATRHPGEYIIVTVDKDMKTIPGRLYRYTPQNPSKGEVQEITHEYARQWFLFQTIQGDSTDNFEGIGTKGWGPKTIDKWITKEGGYTWENVVKLYKQHGKTEEDAIQCARMARILTDNLYNEETGEITYWTPEHLLVPFKDEIVVDVL